VRGSAFCQADTASRDGTIVTSAESGYLSSLASLSLSFVGFSAVVVTLRGALGGELSDRHLRLVRFYIEGGLLLVALALVPRLLELLHFTDIVAWRVSSAVAASTFTVLVLVQFQRRRAVEPGPFPLWLVIVYVVTTGAIASLLLNVAGVPFSPNVGPYAVVLTWALCVFGFTFVGTMDIFLHRDSD